MALTPMDIHNKEFDRSFRGYNEDQVDQFLDKIVEDFERIYKENLELKDKVGALSDQLAQFKTMEHVLKETLVTAQKTAEDVTSTAQKKSELIIREAEDQARRIIEKANEGVVDIQKEYEEVKKQVKLFKSRFRSLLETQMQMISESGPIDFHEKTESE